MGGTDFMGQAFAGALRLILSTPSFVNALFVLTLGLFGLIFLRMALPGGRRRGTERPVPASKGFALPGFAPRLPYERKPLLSAWERRALLSIRGQLPTGFYVCPQVRLADMLRVMDGSEPGQWGSAIAKVASKSVDFAVVELASGDVVLVVELDDRSHDRPDRRDRDAFVNAALDRAGIPIRRFRPDTPIHVRDFFQGVQARQASA